jgi:hypothetical protein
MLGSFSSFFSVVLPCAGSGLATPIQMQQSFESYHNHGIKIAVFS